MTSKVLFCGVCGTPAEKWVPPKPGNPAWRPEWQQGCAHVGKPLRMGTKRAAQIKAHFEASRPGTRAVAIADCAGGEVGP